MRRPTGQYAWFREQLDEFTRQSRRIYADDVEPLHRNRVASRRLREALSLLQPGSETTRKLSRRLRKVTRQLGRVRELDVLMLTIRELGRDTRYPSTALRQVAVAVEEVREWVRDDLAAKLPPAKIWRLARNLERIIKRLESEQKRSHRRSEGRPGPLQQTLSDRTTLRAVQARCAIETAGAVYVPERLHAVRIAVKKLRYSVELAANVRRRRMTADFAALKSAQDFLGRLHDLNVLIARARWVQASLVPPELTAWRDLGSLVRVLEDDCRELHARYMHDREHLMAIVERIGGVESQAHIATG
jgi:CHAD domain-containing protein